MNKTYIIAIVLILGAIIGGGAYWYGTTRKTTTATTATYVDVPVGSARLVAKSSTQNVKVGDQVTVDVLLTTGQGETTGVDLAMHFDPNLLEVVDTDAATAGVQVSPTKVFDFAPANEVTQGTGDISLSLSQQPVSKAVSATDEKIASITFKAKAAGKSDIIFNYTPGSLSDTNVIKTGDGRDLLSNIENTTITITR